MKFYFYPVKVLIIGLAGAEILFSLLVYFSNVSLYHTLVAIKAGGFVIVPNEQVLPSLLKWHSAFRGGVFFSLTIGAGLTLAAFFGVAAWRRFTYPNFGLWILFAAATVFLAIRFHYHLPMTLACGLTLLAAGIAAVKLFPRVADSNGRKSLFFQLFAAHAAVIGIIMLVWVPRFHEDVFISVRDYLLLSNSMGEKINGFYYRYTLYPAEAFKSLDQKLLKSCVFCIADKNLHDQVAEILIDRDYLPVSEHFTPDLFITEEDNTLVFKREGKRIHHCEIEDFLKTPDTVFEKISQKTDHGGFLRKITFFSLIGVSPLICYGFVHAVFMTGLFFIKSRHYRFASAGLLCVLVFTIPAFWVDVPNKEKVSESTLKKGLASDNWRDRVAAMKTISYQDHFLHRYAGIASLTQSPVTVERYWAAKVLGQSRNPESIEQLLRLLDDSQPNVVCMALYSLGKRENPRAVPEILDRLKTSDHWYVQWYAYKSLKRLGWTQKK